jgi:hypothetical protein
VKNESNKKYYMKSENESNNKNTIVTILFHIQKKLNNAEFPKKIL